MWRVCSRLPLVLGTAEARFPNGRFQPFQVIGVDDATLGGVPPVKDGETAVIGHIGIEVNDLEDTKAELTRRGVVLQGEGKTDEVHWTFTEPQTAFGLTLQLMEHKASAPSFPSTPDVAAG